MNDCTCLLDKDEIMLVDKPAGVSSFGVVARVRRQLSEQAGYVSVKGKDGVVRQKRKKIKVGHTGTLDPFATGLLILLVGKGTKHANEFLKLDKEYVATIRLGCVSTTGDLEGDVLPYDKFLQGNRTLLGHDVAPARRCGCRASSSSLVSSGDSQKVDYPTKSASVGASKMKNTSHNLTKETLSDDGVRFIAKPTLEDIEPVVYSFVGEIEQRVPNFSAVKINGQRAYKLAREGKQVEMPVRKIKIYEIEILNYAWPDLTICCKVSSGTYIRALGEDIGKALGVGGYLTSLRRTQVGHYRVEDATKIDV